MNYNEQFNHLFLKMKEEIAAISSVSSNRLQLAEQAYLIASGYYNQVNAAASFDSQGSEIEFYKKIKPAFESELIYFAELYYILASMPDRKKEIIKYIKNQYLPIKLFRQRYQFLYEYWGLGRSDLDSCLFVREVVNTPLLYSQPLPTGDTHALPAGKVFARFRAHRELHGYLERELKKLKSTVAAGESSSIRWTATKAALVELAYALKATGAINNGNSSIRDIATHLEQAFQQDLSQFYRTFQEIRIRKNSRTTFLDRLKQKLEGWMDNTDLNGKGEN